MEYDRQIARLLHDEHINTLAVLDRFDGMLRKFRKTPPDDMAAEPELTRALRDVESLIASEIGGHFDFEEQELFPRLAAFGDGVMGELLTEEHRTLQNTGGQLANDCADLQSGEFEASEWTRFRREAADFAEIMTGHIQKEEMGLLMALEAMLDQDTDQELAMAYSATR
jgi:hemerythrin-like domain-containing protein